MQTSDFVKNFDLAVEQMDIAFEKSLRQFDLRPLSRRVTSEYNSAIVAIEKLVRYKNSSVDTTEAAPRLPTSSFWKQVEHCLRLCEEKPLRSYCVQFLTTIKMSFNNQKVDSLEKYCSHRIIEKFQLVSHRRLCG